MEGDGHRFDRLPGICGTTIDGSDGPGKNCPRGASELGQAESAGRSQPSPPEVRLDGMPLRGLDRRGRQKRESEIPAGFGAVRLAVDRSGQQN